MPDHIALPDDSKIKWTKAVSKNGVPFEYGTLKTDIAKAQSEATARPEAQSYSAETLADDWTTVNWPVTDSDEWIDNHEGGGITRYSLHHYSGAIYDYILGFTNIYNTSFQFKDETDDVYEKHTWTPGDHYLKYNSAQPTIIAYKGLSWGPGRGP